VQTYTYTHTHIHAHTYIYTIPLHPRRYTHSSQNTNTQVHLLASSRNPLPRSVVRFARAFARSFFARPVRRSVSLTLKIHSLARSPDIQGKRSISNTCAYTTHIQTCIPAPSRHLHLFLFFINILPNHTQYTYTHTYTHTHISTTPTQGYTHLSTHIHSLVSSRNSLPRSVVSKARAFPRTNRSESLSNMTLTLRYVLT
jgi:hypothetical protein